VRKKHLIAVLFAALGLVGVVLLAWRLYFPAAFYRISPPAPHGYGLVAPTALNDRGQVVGVINGYLRKSTDSVFLWEPGCELRDLGTFGYPACIGHPRINNAGQIGAGAQDANGVWRALVWDPNTGPHLLSTLGGAKDEVQAMNNRGQLVGSSQTPAGLRHAVLWDDRGVVLDLGTLGGPESLACSINDRGQVAGFSQIASGGWHAFFWDPNRGMRDLGVTDPAAPQRAGIHVNNRGRVVGRFGTPSDPWLIRTWCESDGVRSLVSVPGHEAYPLALNDAGQLLVEVHSTGFDWKHGNLCGAQTEYYLWDPDRGLVLLRRRIGRRGIHDRDFYVYDIDAVGRVAGGFGSRVVLLEPIPERWRR
jgi:probable HAF family extracellular repeat protein